MRSERKILMAFILNILFSLFELFGGLYTKSISIMSDAIHDFGDALSIGLSLFLEKKSKKQPDNKYSYGYLRYSILGAFITTSILTIGSILVIVSSIKRLINPVDVNHDGMILLAIIGVIVNFLAVYFTKDGHSMNQRAVNLHMLEDVLGWIVVLIGSILIKFTNINYIDSIMSFGVSLYILVHAIKNFQGIVDLFLEKTPRGVSIEKIRDTLVKSLEIKDVHHVHVWSIDGNSNYATMHVVTNTKDTYRLKQDIRKICLDLGISHLTIELESDSEDCLDTKCCVEISYQHQHHH